MLAINPCAARTHRGVDDVLHRESLPHPQLNVIELVLRGRIDSVLDSLYRAQKIFLDFLLRQRLQDSHAKLLSVIVTRTRRLIVGWLPVRVYPILVVATHTLCLPPEGKPLRECPALLVAVDAHAAVVERLSLRFRVLLLAV